MGDDPPHMLGKVAIPRRLEPPTLLGEAPLMRGDPIAPIPPDQAALEVSSTKWRPLFRAANLPDSFIQAHRDEILERIRALFPESKRPPTLSALPDPDELGAGDVQIVASLKMLSPIPPPNLKKSKACRLL